MGAAHSSHQDQVLDWLALRLVPGVGSVRFARLVRACGSPGRALGAPLEVLRAVPGVPEPVAQAVHARRFSNDPQGQLARLERMGGRLLTLALPSYPPLLAQVFAPPPVLWVLGDLGPCAGGGVAVVGSRSTSPYGLRVAQKLGQDLARAKVSVISGLARGIDTAAHTGALERGGHTVGVLGCGLDVAYPPENAALAAQMARQGALVSEFPLGTHPAAANFPVRNRIISGLSKAVVVVEGGLRSGALITARHALDQGREVFAVPGPVGTPGVAGCHHLIRQGASLLGSVQDLVDAGLISAWPGGSGEDPGPALPGELPPPARRLLDLMGVEPVHVDLLARESQLDPGQVSALLISLELAGFISCLPGNNYVRN